MGNTLAKFAIERVSTNKFFEDNSAFGGNMQNG